ncbi:MAG: hypothetical protein HYR51_06165 [Candidatus Rokubacteria bacterium]|nr:hypothetical protein [Candidatus Rokubacteria bacterium]
MRKLLFRRRRATVPPILAQGFDVRVTLRRGDKVVRRNHRGEVEIVRVTADVAELDGRTDDPRSR